MSPIAIVKGFFRNAFGIRNNANVERRDDGCGVHPFPSRRERALSDIRRVRMLVQAAEAESGGVANRGTSDSLRQLIPRLGAKGDNVLKDDNGNLFFIDPLIRLKYSALDVIERLTTAASRREV